MRQRRRAGRDWKNVVVEAVRRERAKGSKLLLATLVIEVFDAILVAT